MKVSVVVPAYNEEEYIGGCLDSLKAQIEPADEIIVVDNNSTDRTAQIAASYGAKIIEEKKQGIIPSRNAGFTSAKYEIIARTDADTRPAPDWIKNIKKSFSRSAYRQSAAKPDALTGAVIFTDSWVKTALPAKIFFPIMRLLLGHETLAGPNLALHKQIWEQVKDNLCTDDRKVHEDIDLSIHINRMGGEIVYDRSLIVYSSSRRIRQAPSSFFLEYPARFLRMLLSHRLGIFEENALEKAGKEFQTDSK